MSHPSDPAEQRTAADDSRLTSWLAEMFRRADPPPADAMELARQSFVLRTLDAELAALVEDSDAPADQAAPLAVRDVRTRPERRQLTFQFHDQQTDQDLIIAVEVETRGRHRRLTGHLAPQGPAHIEVRQPAVPRARRVDVDRLGRFVVDDVLPGPASLTCRRAGSPSVTTQWTLV